MLLDDDDLVLMSKTIGRHRKVFRKWRKAFQEEWIEDYPWNN